MSPNPARNLPLSVLNDLLVYLSVPAKTNYSKNKVDFYLKATRFYKGW